MTGAGRASTTGGAPMMDGVATDEIGDDERPRPSTRPTTAVKLLATIPLEETELAEAHPTRTPRLPDPDGQPGSIAESLDVNKLGSEDGVTYTSRIGSANTILTSRSPWWAGVSATSFDDSSTDKDRLYERLRG